MGGGRDETIHTSTWWSGVEFFTSILAIHFIAVSSTFCWMPMTQIGSFDSQGCFSADIDGKEHPEEQEVLHLLKLLMRDTGPTTPSVSKQIFIVNNNEQGGIFWHFLTVCRG